MKRTATATERVVRGFVGGILAGAIGCLVLQVVGLLPPTGSRVLADPCATADAQGLVPDTARLRGDRGRGAATCEAMTPAAAPAVAALTIEVTKTASSGAAERHHTRACAALDGLGTVKTPVGLGDQACQATDLGPVPSTTVFVRVDRIRLMVRYAFEGRDPAALESAAVKAARRVAASP